MKPATLLPFLATTIALPQDVPQDGLGNVPGLVPEATFTASLKPELFRWDAPRIWTYEDMEPLNQAAGNMTRLEYVTPPGGGRNVLALLGYEARTERQDGTPVEQFVAIKHLGTVANDAMMTTLFRLKRMDEDADYLEKDPWTTESKTNTPEVIVASSMAGLGGEKCEKSKCATMLQCGKGCKICFYFHCH